MNVFTAVVRIGNDPEQRFTPGGDSVVSFNGAVDSGFGDKKVTTWIKYTIWGKRGESVLQYLAKGNQVAVTGELANRPWKDKDGQDRYSLEVRVNELTLIGGKKDGQQSEPRQQQQRDSGGTKQDKPAPSFDDLGDDIPF